MRKLAVLAVSAAALALPAASASAATPCWQRLLVDSYDFTIQGTYPAACYLQALKRMPADLRDYSDLVDVLQRALAAVRVAHPHARAVAALPVPPTTKLPKRFRPRATKAPFSVVAADVAPGGPTSLPLPLLVLGGLGGLLTAAGGAGALLRRRRRSG